MKILTVWKNEGKWRKITKNVHKKFVYKKKTVLLRGELYERGRNGWVRKEDVR